jgi:hypothetical protein
MVKVIVTALVASTFLFLAASEAQAAACTEANSIVIVKNSRVGTREYVDFWVKKPVTLSVSAVADNSGPNFREDPSDRLIVVPGNRWSRIRFMSVNWLCSIPENLSLPKPIVRSVKSIEQFEGYVTYIIGRRNKNYLGMQQKDFPINRRYRFIYGQP